MPSPFYILVDLSFSSKYIFHCSELPWYIVERVFHISLVVPLLEMFETM